MKKFLKVLLVIILILAFFALGVYSSDFVYENVINKIIPTNKVEEKNENTEANEVVSDETSEKSVELSAYDKNQLESLYLPLFVATSQSDNELAILNYIVYEYDIQALNNDEYAKYKDDKTIALFDKEEVDNVAKALLGEKAESVLSKQEVDTANNLYTIGGNDSYIPYQVTLKDVSKLENGNYEAKIEYIEFSDGEYLDYTDKYYKDNNLTEDTADSNAIYNSYVETKEKHEATVEFKDAESTLVKYQLVNVK